MILEYFKPWHNLSTPMLSIVQSRILFFHNSILPFSSRYCKLVFLASAFPRVEHADTSSEFPDKNILCNVVFVARFSANSAVSVILQPVTVTIHKWVRLMLKDVSFELYFSPWKITPTPSLPILFPKESQ